MSPLLAIIQDYGSVGPADILRSARGACDIAFVCDTTIPHNAEHLSELRSLGPVVELEAPSVKQLADTLVAMGATGVTTVSEFRIRQAAQVAQACGFYFHDASTATRLTDKFAQRQALLQASVQATRSCLVASEDDVAAAVKAVGLPAVLKPRLGAGSVNTYRIDNAPSCIAAINNAAGPAGSLPEFVLEELLKGDPDILGQDWGDYVSVESLAIHGNIHHVCVMGKFPLAQPFRETGQFAPAMLSPTLTDRVISLADAGLRAVGVRNGVTHTEIKLTATGPQIIEINGRIGGYVSDVLRRASGFDLLRAAIQVAVGQLTRPPRVRFHRIAFRRDLAIPHGRFRLVELQGVDELRQIPGIEHVELRAEPGQVLDSRMGTQECLGEIHGSASDHTELQRITKAASRSLQPIYEPLPYAWDDIAPTWSPAR
jgi:biotin carboxylase